MTDVWVRRGESPTCNTVHVGPVTFVISYETIVAFAANGEGWSVCENVWSKTTGKHLNQETGFIDKKDRLPRDVFERRLASLLSRIEVQPERPTPPMDAATAERFLTEV